MRTGFLMMETTSRCRSCKKTNLDIKVLASAKGKSENSWTFQISNNTSILAFFIRPQLMLGREEILPSYWTSNYFTLAPSETTTVTVSCPAVKLDGKIRQ